MSSDQNTVYLDWINIFVKSHCTAIQLQCMGCHIETLMMEMECISETLVYWNNLMGLLAKYDFMNFVTTTSSKHVLIQWVCASNTSPLVSNYKFTVASNYTIFRQISVKSVLQFCS